MKQPIGYRYRVDNVPVFWQPFFYIYGYAAGIILFLYFWFVRITSSVKLEGLEKLSSHSNYIFCFWHSYYNFYFATFLRHDKHAWMNHPYWYMKPIHAHMRLTGIKDIILGSTGHEGRQAADRLVDYLRKGYSTVICPDGPGGPIFKLRKGILHMSLQSGVSVVPINIQFSRFIEFKRSWD